MCAEFWPRVIADRPDPPACSVCFRRLTWAKKSVYRWPEEDWPPLRTS